MEHDVRGQRPDTAGVDRATGRLEENRERSFVNQRAAVEQLRQRVERRRQLLLAEQQQPDIDRRGGRSLELADELERNRDPALHVGRSETVHGVAVDRAGEVALRGHGVVVAGEYDERGVRATLRRPQRRVVADERRAQ